MTGTSPLTQAKELAYAQKIEPGTWLDRTDLEIPFLILSNGKPCCPTCDGHVVLTRTGREDSDGAEHLCPCCGLVSFIRAERYSHNGEFNIRFTVSGRMPPVSRPGT